jgi:hypothetical protein
MGDRLKPDPGAGPLQRLRRIPVQRQVQGHEPRDALGCGEIEAVVDAVQMHHVGAIATHGVLDERAQVSVDLLARRGVDRPVRTRGGDQQSRGPGAFRRHDDGAAAALGDGAVEAAEHLFGAAHGIGVDARERVGDAEYGQAHAASSSRRKAAAAQSRQRAPVSRHPH